MNSVTICKFNFSPKLLGVAKYSARIWNLSPAKAAHAAGIDGVIVGSALCRVIGQAPTAPDLPARMVEKIRDLRSGLDRA